MRKIYLIFVFGAIALSSFGQSMGQKLNLNLSAGTSLYAGDMQSYFFKFTQPGLTLGGGISCKLSDRISIRGGITYASLNADDKKNPRVYVRNLNFKTKIKELHLAAEYYLFNLEDFKFSPYVFGGIAVYHFNPYTKDTSGSKFYLQPLSTEGQGFYQDRKPYNLTQFAIPFGGGMKYMLTENINIGFEIGMRKLFTDYLDDVSKTYVDPNLLLTNRGQKALELAFRAAEINKAEKYPTGYSKRGEDKNKDWYYFTCFTLSIRLPAKGEIIKDELDRPGIRKKYIPDCPKK